MRSWVALLRRIVLFRQYGPRAAKVADIYKKVHHSISRAAPEMVIAFGLVDTLFEVPPSVCDLALPSKNLRDVYQGSYLCPGVTRLLSMFAGTRQ
jgi:hypothetical protein